MKLRYGKGEWRKSEHPFMGRTKHIFLNYLLNRQGYMKNWPARLRAVWYAWICLYDGEICNDCGRPVARGIGTWWTAPDGFWMEVTQRYSTILCPACFADRCMEHDGTLIYWAPLISRMTPEDEKLERDQERLSTLERNLRDGSRLE